MQALTEYIIYPIAAIVIYILGGKVKKYIHKYKNDHDLDATSQKNIKIYGILSEMLNEFNATRAYLSMFHNGDTYIDGSAIFKISRTNEACRPGVSSEYQTSINVLVSTIHEIISCIGDDNFGIINISKLTHDSRLKQIMISQGATSSAICLVGTKKKPICIVGLDFDNNIDIKESDVTNYIARIKSSL